MGLKKHKVPVLEIGDPASLELAELRRKVVELQEANDVQTRFLEDMTHELKNPLCVIWGYVNYLLLHPVEDCSPAEITRALKSIHRNAEHLTAMVEELMDAARLDSRKVVLRKTVFPAGEAVLEAVESLRLQAREKGLALTADCPPEPVALCADRNRLRQILVNLITNALKFTPSGGKVVVRLREDAGRAQFCVEDDGRGMEPAQAKRIFERFYQVSDPVDGHKGLGLGLHIVSRLVSLHGGRIWVESAPGAGSRFYFTIPAAPEAGSPAASGAPRIARSER